MIGQQRNSRQVVGGRVLVGGLNSIQRPVGSPPHTDRLCADMGAGPTSDRCHLNIRVVAMEHPDVDVVSPQPVEAGPDVVVDVGLSRSRQAETARTSVRPLGDEYDPVTVAAFGHSAAQLQLGLATTVGSAPTAHCIEAGGIDRVPSTTQIGIKHSAAESVVGKKISLGSQDRSGDRSPDPKNLKAAHQQPFQAAGFSPPRGRIAG